jgi:hypothetical protein
VSRLKLTRKRLLALTTVASVVVAGLAFAFWTAGGSGSGTGSTGAGATGGIGVVQTSTVSGLTPGDAGAALSGNFTNTNNQSVHVTSVTATVRAFSTHTVDAAKPDCTQDDYQITGGAVSTPNTVTANSEVPANAGQGANPNGGSWSGLTVQLKQNASANQDNCKGKSITIDYTSN